MGVFATPRLAYAGVAATRTEAEGYAARTYIVQPPFGRRHFEVYGKRQVVTASDGSRIAAFRMVLNDSGDGTGQAVVLFRNKQFIGWASNRDTVKLFGLSGSGHSIRVKYGVYSGNDSFCCPSAYKTIRYQWNRSRLTRSAPAPRIYGSRGDQLRLEKQNQEARTASSARASLGAADHTLRGASSCGDLRVYYHENGTRQYIDMTNIRSHKASCGRAIQVARRWGHKSRLSCCPASSGAGFHCTYYRAGSDVGSAACRKNGKSVKFDAYDSSPYH